MQPLLRHIEGNYQYVSLMTLFYLLRLVMILFYPKPLWLAEDLIALSISMI
ncbi:hypothetical protein ACWIVU_10135 [Ursidibacter arcticus]